MTKYIIYNHQYDDFLESIDIAKEYFGLKWTPQPGCARKFSTYNKALKIAKLIVSDADYSVEIVRKIDLGSKWGVQFGENPLINSTTILDIEEKQLERPKVKGFE